MNPLAMVWLAEALLGVFVIVLNMRSAGRDLWRMRGYNGSKEARATRMLGWNTVAQEGLRLVPMLGATWLGVIAVGLPMGTVTTWGVGFIVGLGLIVLASLLESWVRRRLRSLFSPEDTE